MTQRRGAWNKHPVPGKPGYVVSPFDTKGRYIDVSSYPSGSKAKDPWTDKIFIVP